MTVTEIIKGLEKELHHADYHDLDYEDNVPVALLNSAYNLIKRQQMEIERLESLVGEIDEKHGKWNDKGNCSACGKNVYDDMNADIWSRYAPPFCPNCGAKMQEGNDLNG